MSINTTLARPYAKAAFAEAMVTNTVSAWSQLLQFAAQVVRDSRVINLLRDPRHTEQARLTWLVDICATVLHEDGRNLFKLLAANHRLEVLPAIADLFEVYRVEQEKTTHVEVTSAVPLSSTEQQQLVQALKIRLQREITLDCQVDANLLAGFVVRAGDLVIDGSVRGKLTRLSAALIN